MKIHFIGIGERILGDLAVTVCQQGHQVTGSDVSFSQLTLYSLESAELVPTQPGWFPQKITKNLDKVIVGRQVHPDNPELHAAQRLGLPILSYPQYIYDHAQDKQRIVITGGKDKTLICVLILHVLTYCHKKFDYVVDSPNLEASVQLSNAPIMILEGDVDPSACTDTQPQSLRYQHNIVLISGIDDWKISDTYPTLETYVEQMNRLANASPKGGALIYCQEDNLIHKIGSQARADVKAMPYNTHAHRYGHERAYLITPQEEVPFQYADTVSMRAVAGARQILHTLAIPDQRFYKALTTFFID